MPYAVITRDLDAAPVYATALAGLGLDTIAVPVTRIEVTEGALEAVLGGRGGYAAIACTSPRAARLLAAAATAPRDHLARPIVETHPPECAGPAPRPALDATGRVELPEVWAVGAATARVLEEANIIAICDTAVTDGSSLAAAMLAARSLAGCRVLVPRAQGGRPELIDALVDAGVVVDTVDVYRTIPLAIDASTASEIDGAAVVCVFAPSQVEALDAVRPIRRLRCPVVAIGETTGAALRGAGATTIAVAATPTPEGLANAVATVYPRTR